MKKITLTLVAAGCLGLLAETALAASVQMYGRVDNGVYFTNVKKGGTTTKSLTMESGMGGASRWGIKATSDEIAQGWTVSMKLEGKIGTDTGEMGTSGTIFDRESSIIVASPYGKLQFGRLGYLHGGVTGGIIAGQTNPFGVIYKQCGAQNVFLNAAARTPNTIRYETPNYSGLTLIGQWCNSVKDEEEGNALPNRQRYFGIGANYRNGPLRIAAVYGTMFYSRDAKTSRNAVEDDEHSYSISGNYNFGPAKVFAGYQYGENLSKNTSLMGTKILGAKTHNMIAGVSAPVAGGTLMFATAYVKGKDGTSTARNDFVKQDAYQFALGYKYNFSKKTALYTATSYRNVKATKKSGAEQRTKTFALMAGLGVNF